MLIIEGEPRALDLVLAVDAYGEAPEKPARPLAVFRTPVNIDGDLWLERIDADLAEAVMDACSPRGEHFQPVHQFGASYAFIRRDAPEPNELAMDPDNRLYACVALSRLVHPTAVGYAYAARVRMWSNGARQIIPRRETHLNPLAFVDDVATAWLNPDDAIPIGDLVRSYYRVPPPPRVHSALWYFEAAARSYYIDLKWTLLVTGLEALVHVRSERHPSRPRSYAGSTKVFVDRLSAVASLDSSLFISPADLTAIYGARSHVAHGGLVAHLPTADAVLYRRLESFTRLLLRKAVLEPTFGAIFANDMSVRSSLPLAP